MLLTEEAAKTALVMPFLQALGYNVFNPAEVIPEFTCDVGMKKGEKVDYAICIGGKVSMLIECKPANVELSIKNASQLYRYFGVTDARVAVLTNGVVYKFFSDLDAPNKMDEKPFFVCQIDTLRPHDIRVLGGFGKAAFDIEKIVDAAVGMKMQSLVHKALEAEFADPSDDLVRLIATKVHPGKLTQPVKDRYKGLIVGSFAALVRDKVTERLKSALSASAPPETEADAPVGLTEEIETTEDELTGFNIVRAIAAKVVDPKRIVLRDAKSYAAILLDDNNRKTIARLHFNSASVKYLGTFAGKDETRHQIAEPVDIYGFDKALLARIAELANS